ncbi:MAG: hypothetical protein J6Y20_11385 [Lachnospiraceae bacterium]|nr:hypothetical protein [Lachnospiraceae bacterium]
MGTIKVPALEQAWVTFVDTKGEPVCVITSKPARDYYYLYEVGSNGNLKKLGKSRSPVELEEKYGVAERMRRGSS